MNGLGVKTYVMSGNSFIDVRDPGGLLGNPFTVIMDREVGTWRQRQRQALARRSGTPETILVNARLEPREPERIMRAWVNPGSTTRRRLA